jgi:hypothetical protein
VKVFAHGGEMLCQAGQREERCYLSRLLTRQDIPLRVELWKGGEKKHGEEVNYTVLSGPIDTTPFVGNVYFEEPKVDHYTVTVTKPVFVRCDGPDKNTEEICTATRRSRNRDDGCAGQHDYGLQLSQ